MLYFYSAFDIIPQLGSFIIGTNGNSNIPNLAWDHLSNPLLVGVPKALRSVILNYQQTNKSLDEEKTYFPVIRRRRSFSKETRFAYFCK